MFHRILSIFVFLLIILDAIILLGAFGVFSFSDIIQENLPIFIAMICIQIPILYAVTYFSYISPIQQLNRGIARFYTGLDEDLEITTNSWSKGMKDVTSFFTKSLQILKVFKTELREGRKLRSEVEIASEIQSQSISQKEDKIP